MFVPIWIIVILALIFAWLLLLIHGKNKQIEEQEQFVRECQSKERSINAKLNEVEEQLKKSNREISNRNKELANKEKDFQSLMDYRQRTFEKQIAKEQNALRKKENELLDRESILELTKSNLTAIPYMASIIADFDTRGIEILAKNLDWGVSIERLKKVQSIRLIRAEAQDLISKYKEAYYQLQYALKMFPALSDFLETDYNLLPEAGLFDIKTSVHDVVRDYLSKEEYTQLSTAERNQLALDRYMDSHKKTNWQIGRDYEMYIGYKYTKKGYSVEYFGAYNGLDDLGRDLIAKKGNEILIIQCKYWSSKKIIHENHINQLYGTVICYCLEHGISPENVRGVLVTNISLSDTAKRFANYLGVSVVEKYEIDRYPCIKCNINRDQYGNITKIYHLPFDQQYDSCKIDSPGEFFATTTAEAEEAGFRRAYHWHSN